MVTRLFRPKNSAFLSASLVLCSVFSSQNALSAATTDFSLQVCKKAPQGQRAIGWGKYGLHFRVPKEQVNVSGGKADVDYVRYVVTARNGHGSLELWFGGNALPSMPNKTSGAASMSEAKIRNEHGNVVGVDYVGHLVDGTRWRHFVVAHEGAVYSNIDPDTAGLYDKIIDSACFVPYPN